MMLLVVFFQDELIHYNPPEFYEIDVLDTRGKGKKKEHLVHYRGWPNSYNEWKKAYDMNYMQEVNIYLREEKNLL